MTNSTILSVNGLSKSYQSGDRNIRVLKNISFAVEKRTACAVVGPSGSGKTTLLGLCAGLDRPTTGTVTLNHIELNQLNEDELAEVRNKHTGFVFQTFQLIPTLTALENIMVPAELGGEAQAKSHAMELLKCVGLVERAGHFPSQLSGGEQQRVAIARSFINRPRILFADEPTGNLDAETGRRIISLLFELNTVAGTTLVLSTHDPELTRSAGRVIQLKDGMIFSDKMNEEEEEFEPERQKSLPL